MQNGGPTGIRARPAEECDYPEKSRLPAVAAEEASTLRVIGRTVAASFRCAPIGQTAGSARQHVPSCTGTPGGEAPRVPGDGNETHTPPAYRRKTIRPPEFGTRTPSLLRSRQTRPAPGGRRTRIPVDRPCAGLPCSRRPQSTRLALPCCAEPGSKSNRNIVSGNLDGKTGSSVQRSLARASPTLLEESTQLPPLPGDRQNNGEETRSNQDARRHHRR